MCSSSIHRSCKSINEGDHSIDLYNQYLQLNTRSDCRTDIKKIYCHQTSSSESLNQIKYPLKIFMLTRKLPDAENFPKKFQYRQTFPECFPADKNSLHKFSRRRPSWTLFFF